MDRIGKLDINVLFPSETGQDEALSEAEKIYSDYMSDAISETFDRFSGYDISLDKVRIDLGTVSPPDIPYALSRELERVLSEAASRPSSYGLKDDSRLLLEYLRTGTISESYYMAHPEGAHEQASYRTASPMDLPEFRRELDVVLSDAGLFEETAAEFRKDRRSFYRFIDILDADRKERLLRMLRKPHQPDASEAVPVHSAVPVADEDDSVHSADAAAVAGEAYANSSPAYERETAAGTERSYGRTDDAAYEAETDDGAERSYGALREDPVSERGRLTAESSVPDSGQPVRITADEYEQGDIDRRIEQIIFGGAVCPDAARVVECLRASLSGTEMLSEDERIHVDDAGLIIVSPFLPRLFSNLGYLDEEGKFADADSQVRAVHLVRCLAYGFGEKHTENRLVLPKVLCGLPLMFPAGPKFVPTEKETSEASELLETVRSYWKSLKNTSVGGMTESFIRRHGSLEKDGNGWLLRVEGRAYDILMDEIPWGFTTFLPAWNDLAIFTEWQKEY